MKKPLLSLLLLISLVGCKSGGGTGDDPERNGPGDEPADVPEVIIPQTELFSSDFLMDKSADTECQVLSENSSFKQAISFGESDDTFFQRTDFYNTNACSGYAPSHTIYVEGTYELLQELHSSAQKINITVLKQEVEVVDPNFATLLNSNSVCGYTTWQVGENYATEITGLNCQSGAVDLGYVYSSSQVVYSIVNLSNTALYFGDLSDVKADSDLTRPSTVSEIKFRL